jgi:tripartite ATP-independent transporter DctP family solute receptor
MQRRLIDGNETIRETTMERFTPRRRHKLQLLLAIVALAPWTPAMAQDVKPRTIKFATQNPKGHPIVIGMEKFAELVSARSGGKIKVNLFPGGVLGGDAQNVSALQGGTLEMASMNAGILAAQVKEFAVFDFPFMFGSAQEADGVVDGPFGKMMFEKLEPKNIHGLAYWELGFRSLTNGRRPINRIEDIAGLKLRVIPNAINIDWVTAVGANPTPMAFPEVYAALEQRAIDGQENPLSVILANRFQEVQKHLTITNHQYNPQAVIVSKRFWGALSDAEKKLLSDAAADATPLQRSSAREQNASALEQLKKGGMQVTEVTGAELQKFRDKVKPVIDKHSAIVGVEVVTALQNELARSRK